MTDGDHTKTKYVRLLFLVLTRSQSELAMHPSEDHVSQATTGVPPPISQEEEAWRQEGGGTWSGNQVVVWRVKSRERLTIRPHIFLASSHRP